MTSKDIFEELRNYCVEHADPENVKKSQRYFKEPYVGYGLTTAQTREKVKELSKFKELTPPIVIDIINMSLNGGMYEEISMSLLLLNNLSKQFSMDTFNSIAGFFEKGVTNWAHADILGMFMLPKFISQNIANTDDFIKWLKSPYKFQRRCVPVTFIKPMKVTKNVLPYIAAIEPLMSDAEREVHQGAGWFLREAWKINRRETECFLEKWKDTAPRLIMQYACEKMTSEEKKRFKKN
jgi:3-methyladenine DNA glycosylase AlkD